jgi:hypothetical protein
VTYGKDIRHFASARENHPFRPKAELISTSSSRPSIKPAEAIDGGKRKNRKRTTYRVFFFTKVS